MLIVKKIILLFKSIFAERTLVFVTSKGIKNFTLSPFLQFCAFLLLTWLLLLLQQSIRYDNIISSKLTEIKKLKSINKYFESEFEALNDELEKVNDYLKVISGDKHSVNSKTREDKFLIPKKLQNIELSKVNHRNIEKLRIINSQISDVASFAKNRILELEEAINITGLNLESIPKKNFLNQVIESPRYLQNNSSNLAIGGPLEDNEEMNKQISKSTLDYDFARVSKKAKFSNKVSHLIFLENLANNLPLNKPMKDFYVSSGFGYRIDPITKTRALHRGQDFVGPENAKIISPSRGKVIIADYFAEYGKAVVIDHGFGITTRYGHLSKINVQKGQIVNKNDVIGFQGSTGRSTGNHLHYEIRYKNSPLNPRKFIKAGEQLFGDDESINYINS